MPFNQSRHARSASAGIGSDGRGGARGYLRPVNWQPGDLITAKRLNQTDAGVDKNAEEIVKIKSDKPTAIQTNLIDNLF